MCKRCPEVSGWHVCLDVIEVLLNGEEFGDRKHAWEEQYKVYTGLVERMRNS